MYIIQFIHSAMHLDIKYLFGFKYDLEFGFCMIYSIVFIYLQVC